MYMYMKLTTHMIYELSDYKLHNVTIHFIILTVFGKITYIYDFQKGLGKGIHVCLIVKNMPDFTGMRMYAFQSLFLNYFAFFRKIPY